jgi:mono/diheme cytochrome c family protein
MNRIVVAMLLSAAGCALAASAWAAPEPPPGGSAWVRADVNAAGQPRGYVQFQDYCSACHAAGPEQRPGTEALRAKYHGTRPALLSQRTDLTPALIRFVVRNGITIMPFFRKTEISDASLDAIVAYLTRNNASTHNPASGSNGSQP